MISRIDSTKTLIEILQAIYSQPGITISELAKKFNLPMSTMSVLIKQLKEMNVISIYIDEKNIEVNYKDTKYTRRIKVKRLVPSGITCTKTGTVIVPYMIANKGEAPLVGLRVFNCPFVKECPYVNQKTLQPGYCKLYDMLSEDEKKELVKILSNIEQLLSKFKDNNTPQKS
jgi:DNA-binding MarR family transcriptional regulator